MIGFEYCSKHLKEICNLAIKNSNLPEIGVGLFVNQNFKKGAMILKYNGEVLEESEYDIRYKNIKADGPYAIFLNRTHTLDSACLRGTASLVNHKRKNLGANTVFKKKSNGVFLYALRDILVGEELYADYGRGYIFEKNFQTFNENSVIF